MCLCLPVCGRVLPGGVHLVGFVIKACHTTVHGGVTSTSGKTDCSTGNTDYCIGNTDCCTGNTDSCIGNTDSCTSSADYCTRNTDYCTCNTDDWTKALAACWCRWHTLLGAVRGLVLEAMPGLGRPTRSRDSCGPLMWSEGGVKNHVSVVRSGRQLRHMHTAWLYRRALLGAGLQPDCT